jgi:hypothetical protein
MATDDSLDRGDRGITLQNFTLIGKAMVLAVAMIYFITNIYGGLIS